MICWWRHACDSLVSSATHAGVLSPPPTALLRHRGGLEFNQLQFQLVLKTHVTNVHDQCVCDYRDEYNHAKHTQKYTFREMNTNTTRKPCCRKVTARCRKCSFLLKFANNIHYKYKTSQASKAATLQSSKHADA